MPKLEIDEDKIRGVLRWVWMSPVLLVFSPLIVSLFGIALLIEGCSRAAQWVEDQIVRLFASGTHGAPHDPA